MFEIIQTRDLSSRPSDFDILQEDYRLYDLFVDGKHVEDSWVSANPPFWVTIYDHEIWEKLILHRFNEFPVNVHKLTFRTFRTNFDSIDSTWHISIVKKEKEVFEIQSSLNFEFEHWKRPYSISEYVAAFKYIAFFNNALESSNHPEFRFEVDEVAKGNGLTMIFPVPSPHSSIESQLLTCSTTVNKFDEETTGVLESRLHNKSVVMHFDFPEEVRVPCEQYLLYFVQFLRDIGINTTAELQPQQVGQILFAVTPTNPNEALDKIRQALEIYIKLPSSPINTSQDLMSNDIAVQRLVANINHLKGQLALAHATLQTKDATIETQRVTIQIQQSLLSGSIFQESAQEIPITPKTEEKEKVLGGVLALGKYEGKGFDINLGELFRQLKRYFNSEK